MQLKTYFIKTFGCQMNFSDSERMMTFLEQNGLTLSQADSSAEALAKADLVIFNTCGVRQTAEDRVYGLIHNIRKFHNDPSSFRKKKPLTRADMKNQKHNLRRPIIILTGCLAHRQDVQKKLRAKADLFLPIADFPKIFKLLSSQFTNPGQKDFIPTTSATTDVASYLCIPPKYEHQNKAFVPIMTGCNNFCSYCVVPYARNREWSRPMEDIFQEIDNLSQKGCQEITLLGQNVNSYNYKIKKRITNSKNTNNNLTIKQFNNESVKETITFPLLLNKLAQAYPQIKFIFLTSHPKDFSEELMDVIAANDNISKEIHLPIQAGSDKILKAMNRPYTQKHYLGLIKKAQEKIPGVSFTVDVIVGFPGETEEDFQETVKVFQTVKYNEAYINKYSPRPGTAAYKLEDTISWDEKKRREKILRQIVKNTH